jgi:diaminopimelate decarboxylase
MRSIAGQIMPEDVLAGNHAGELIERFGSPLYVYSERILRARCRELIDMVSGIAWQPDYSMKANGNVRLLAIIREEGLHCDTMSPGETSIAMAAGFTSDQILFVPNNVSVEELRSAVQNGVLVSLDSLSQLRRFGEIAPGERCAIRINPGSGAGHHQKVVTAGGSTKFGISVSELGEAKDIAAQFGLRVVGINQHIGSLFIDDAPWLEACRVLLEAADEFPDLEWVDFGGGFGFSYRRDGEYRRMDLRAAGGKLVDLCRSTLGNRAERMRFRCEPGRYVVAECGMLIGTVHAIKENGGIMYCGTDIGMNVLMRHVLYDAWHEIVLLRRSPDMAETARYRVTGNICESGDVLGERTLPVLREGDLLGVMDAGAYGYSMASSYNGRGRPAEVLVREDGTCELIRRRESDTDLMNLFV